MSFILDALKKSESDRQRQSGPSLFEVKVAPPRRRLPVWAVAIAVLLGINVMVISWMLLRRPAAQQPAAAIAPATVTRAMAATVSAPAPSAPSAAAAPATAARTKTASAANGAVPQAASDGASAKTAAAPSANPREGSASAALPGSTAQSSGQPPGSGNPSDYAPAVEPAGTRDSAVTAGAAGGLPLYQQIVASAELPPLHLDLHVYTERPQDRFVMINMRKLGEGDSLPGGPQVKAIRPDGVVLSYHGTRFLLPRN